MSELKFNKYCSTFRARRSFEKRSEKRKVLNLKRRSFHFSIPNLTSRLRDQTFANLRCNHCKMLLRWRHIISTFIRVESNTCCTIDQFVTNRKKRTPKPLFSFQSRRTTLSKYSHIFSYISENDGLTIAFPTWLRSCVKVPLDSQFMFKNIAEDNLGDSRQTSREILPSYLVTWTQRCHTIQRRIVSVTPSNPNGFPWHTLLHVVRREEGVK